MSCVIVIPIYKYTPNLTESASFIQCLKILSKHDICIITYSELNLYNYYNLANNISIKIKYFSKEYFDSVNGYNRLCLSKDFYNSFIEYEYMLIYQLDAWVFRDELDDWCKRGYDYIGAPWFKIDKKGNYTKDFLGVGNGGFSLRRIKYCIDLLNYPPRKPFIKPLSLFKQIKSIKDFIKFPFNLLGIRNNLYFFMQINKNEDYIFSQLSAHSRIKVNLPSNDIAMKFSFEINPYYLWTLNNKKLPFGCHAFEKYEFESFWYKFIDNKNIHIFKYNE